MVSTAVGKTRKKEVVSLPLLAATVPSIWFSLLKIASNLSAQIKLAT